MNYNFLNYLLPDERIAQRPIGKGEARSRSKLLVALPSASQVTIVDDYYFNIAKYLQAGDLLVMNKSRVIPARFFISPDSFGEIEILLLQHISGEEGVYVQHWEALAKPMKRLKEGLVYRLADELYAKILGRGTNGDKVLIELCSKSNVHTVFDLISRFGSMPIPPYIRAGHSDDEDKETYQTIYASDLGSIAAPTAGLHFTEPLLAKLATHGVEVHYLTLHVGSSSFLPIRESQIDSHKMSCEYYSISRQTARAIEHAKSSGRRIVAVGTTTLRALESYFLLANNDHSEAIKSTNIFITPGFNFKAVDVLITNFHQPQSTHLLLVAAFSGANNIEAIYNHALANDYRFLSYGDGMILTRLI
ncbi:MAG: tRNA preQ1(34) S-adenosylmethionine ribosyltransferase-isomerase QueA [Deltaproteobacteria bacterium]|nr:tRNA preQ1(34) S-adenosylmethionine ribosyltransferase-isomerase QueA [Deltaproteobacteria bacterium]